MSRPLAGRLSVRITAGVLVAALLGGCSGYAPRATRTPTVPPRATARPRVTSAAVTTRWPSPTRTPTRRPPTITPTRSPTPLPDAVVTADSAYVRAGPGSHYEILLMCPQSTLLAVLGRSSGGLWLQVRAPEGSLGWVQRSDVHLNRVFKELPTVEAPPW